MFKKIRFLSFGLLALGVTFIVQGATCRPSHVNEILDYLSGRQGKDPCEYYRCLSQRLGCSDEDYLLYFGHKYCKKLSHFSYPAMTEIGQVWFRETMECLQLEVLENIIDFESRGLGAKSICKKLSDRAMDSHINCYEKTNFCSQRKMDRISLWSQIEMKDLAMLKADGWTLARGAQLLRNCARGPEIDDFERALSLSR